VSVQGPAGVSNGGEAHILWMLVTVLKAWRVWTHLWADEVFMSCLDAECV
jgi:hypothetical protein